MARRTSPASRSIAVVWRVAISYLAHDLDPPPSASSGNQVPETAFTAVLGFQPDSIGCVRLEGAEFLDYGCEALTLHDMSRGMAIAARPSR